MLHDASARPASVEAEHEGPSNFSAAAVRDVLGQLLGQRPSKRRQRRGYIKLMHSLAVASSGSLHRIVMGHHRRLKRRHFIKQDLLSWRVRWNGGHERKSCLNQV